MTDQPLRPGSSTVGLSTVLETLGSWCLGLLWLLPLVYAVWTAIHPAAYEVKFDLSAPLTFANFVSAWNAAPFARYFLNTFLLITITLCSQFVICTLAGYAFARLQFRGKTFLFFIVLMQLMIMPEILMVENYRTMNTLGLVDTVLAIMATLAFAQFTIFDRRVHYK